MPEKKLLPTGECWCGCGKEVGLGSFFAPGHDKWAEGYVTMTRYGSVAAYIDAHEYGPNGKNAREEASAVEQYKHFIQLSIRASDPVSPESVAQAIEDQGGIRTRNGFAFSSSEARDAAYAVVAQAFSDKFIAAVETA